MSTSRTDMQFDQWSMEDLSVGHKLLEAKKFARQLETELTAAEADAERFKECVQWYADFAGTTEINHDYGKRAQQTLAAHEARKGGERK